MQHADRAAEPVPAFLLSKDVAAQRWRLAEFFSLPEARQAQSAFDTAALPLSEPTLTSALHRLFRGRCAFCDERAPTRPYRFRPAAEALPLARSTRSHLYYAWLAWAWENIYPICDGCLPEKPDLFPVGGERCQLPDTAQLVRHAEHGEGFWGSYPPAEQPQLLDPCIDRAWQRHFRIGAGGDLVAISARGGETRQHFALGRPELARSRAECLAGYVDHLLEWISYDALFNFREMEFGGAWHLLLRQAAAALSGRAPAEIAGLRRFFRTRLAAPAGIATVRAAFDQAQEGTSALTFPPAPPRRSAARLQQIELRNVKALEHLVVDMPEAAPPSPDGPAAPGLLVLGENAAGKSSLLEAVALALCSPAARQELRLKPEKLVLKPALMGDSTRPRPCHAEVTLHFDDGHACRLRIGDDGMEESWDEGATPPPVFAYGAFRQFLEGERRYSPAKHVHSLFKGDYILSNPEKWLLGLDEPTFAQVVRDLRLILAVGRDFEVMERDGEQCFVAFELDGPEGRPVRSVSPLSVVSSGFRTVLAMACDIMQGLMDPRVHANFETMRLARAVVLIDEIEAHLHPRWKIQVIQGFRRTFPNITFIATTHDPLCIRGMSHGEVMVLQRVASPASDTRSALPVIVEKLEALPRIDHLTVEQLLTSDFFQMFSTDAPEIEAAMARIGDLLARQAGGDALTAEEKEQLRRFRVEVAASVPGGSSPVQREVEKAVAEVLAERRRRVGERIKTLEDQTRVKIVNALRGL
jgi:hypothetical protein